jgi:DNA-binding NarL/FixJ family response regulator
MRRGLAGAKWHVSEVMSKLGVSCREEVARCY